MSFFMICYLQKFDSRHACTLNVPRHITEYTSTGDALEDYIQVLLMITKQKGVLLLWIRIL